MHSAADKPWMRTRNREGILEGEDATSRQIQTNMGKTRCRCGGGKAENLRTKREPEGKARTGGMTWDRGEWPESRRYLYSLTTATTSG